MATQNNKPVLHRKEWQFMTPAPVASAAAMFVVFDQNDVANLALYITSNTSAYLYHHDEDAWVQIASPALAGTFGAGACGTSSRWSNTVTANGGSTTTATTTAAITGICIGRTVRFLTGANAGVEATITGAIIVPGGTSTIQFAALGAAVANTDTFIVSVSTFYVLGAGTLAAASFRSYDVLTATWTSLTNTGLPATWGTDGVMCCTAGISQFATGTATSGTSTTLTNSAKAWATNQWCNSQVRITAGTGIGQIRTIATNTGTVLTVSAAWTVTPDATSVYAIESNQDHIYLVGNNAVTMYRYSRAANTWTTLAPTTARAAAPAAGASLNWVGKTGDANWALEADIKDGRYLYSVRGGASTVIDRYDIAGGTAGAGAWLALTYPGATETFTTGSSADWSGRYIYIRKDATNRFFKFSVRGNYMEALATNLYADGAAVLGCKIWVKDYDGTDTLKWLYSLRNTGTELHRLPLF
jgi:hypothetical protein